MHAKTKASENTKPFIIPSVIPHEYPDEKDLTGSRRESFNNVKESSEEKDLSIDTVGEKFENDLSPTRPSTGKWQENHDNLATKTEWVSKITKPQAASKENQQQPTDPSWSGLIDLEKSTIPTILVDQALIMDDHQTPPSPQLANYENVSQNNNGHAMIFQDNVQEPNLEVLRQSPEVCTNVSTEMSIRRPKKLNSIQEDHHSRFYQQKKPPLQELDIVDTLLEAGEVSSPIHSRGEMQFVQHDFLCRIRLKFPSNADPTPETIFQL
ncbi:hypothetical protein ACH5RR_037111 [Cinchona calisaya]|uniref:Uncharacterized protein n=1 Tax=Cinchona calisaya TaxID=153742 RepID=A0ABD2Y561_9GENT